MFKKVIENFVCEKCGTEVKGNGFTNHCPKCLWSKHVDNDPGDRESNCGGMMEPINFFKEGTDFVLVHKCIVCDIEKRNKFVANDNFDVAVEISKKFAEKQ